MRDSIEEVVEKKPHGGSGKIRETLDGHERTESQRAEAFPLSSLENRRGVVEMLRFDAGWYKVLYRRGQCCALV